MNRKTDRNASRQPLIETKSATTNTDSKCPVLTTSSGAPIASQQALTAGPRGLPSPVLGGGVCGETFGCADEKKAEAAPAG